MAISTSPPSTAKYRSFTWAARLITTNMAKKTTAAPVSPWSSHSSMGTKAWHPSSTTCRGLSISPFLRRVSRCLPKVRQKKIFTSSEDWNVLPAMLIHARAFTPPLPWTASPKTAV